MDIGGIIISVVLAGFLIATVSIFLGHGGFFLGGLSFKSEEEYRRFNYKKFLKFIGLCFIMFDIALILVLISHITKLEVLSIIAGIIFLVTSILATIYMKTGERFKR